MKILYIKKNISVLSLLLLALIFMNACRKNQISIKEPVRYSFKDVSSYSDLFEAFWNTMDQSYNYFYEQERIDGMDWDAIYKKYKPKFSALKSFMRGDDFTDLQILNDGDSARKYFEDIINPIIDGHFTVRISMPISRNEIADRYYKGNMKDTSIIGFRRLLFSRKFEYMKKKVLAGQSAIESSFSAKFAAFRAKGIDLIAGPLISHPDVYYVAFEDFRLATGGLMLILSDKYFSPDKSNKYVFPQEDIGKSEELKKIADTALRRKALETAIKIYKNYNDYFNSDLVKQFNVYVKHFNKTEEISEDFVNITRKLMLQMRQLLNYGNERDPKVYPPEVGLSAAVRPFLIWFAARMYYANLYAYELDITYAKMGNIVAVGDFYSKFLNPLHKGAIKKLIIDLRDNTGGAVVDGSFFVDRFVTKVTHYASQRTREGNARFDYTPWVSISTKKHKFGMPKEIPIVILTDGRSASMSELSILKLKSQGDHVITVGSKTFGATSGLGPSELFNGGLSAKVGIFLEFYIPVMATRDAKGVVVERKGIEPDYKVDPPTVEEIFTLRRNPAAFTDRAFEQALKVINGL